MSTEEFIITPFIRVDSVIGDVPKRSDAHLFLDEIVTLALLFALKGVKPRAFYRWLHNSWFPGLPKRTQMFRLFAAYTDWAKMFLAQATYNPNLLQPIN